MTTNRDAGHWRMRAEELRTLAEAAREPEVRAIMVRIAADYDRLAKYAPDFDAFNSLMNRTAADYDPLFDPASPKR